MGCGASSPEGASAALAEKQLKRTLEDQQASEAKKVKLLILGAGESGKSTFFKQMKLLYGAPFTSEEAEYMRGVIHENVMDTVQELAGNVTNFLDIDVQNLDAKAAVLEAASDDDLAADGLGDMVKELWEDPAVQAMWQQRYAFTIFLILRDLFSAS